MGILSCTLFLLLLAVQESIQKSGPTSLTYKAAVVELRPIEYTNNAAETLDHCATKIVSFIEQAAKKKVDIVVFPEMGLTSLTLGTRADLVARSTLVPDPSQNYTPCTNSSIPVIEALKRVACAAERNNIYVVVNLLEKEICSLKNCPSDGLFVYISSAVFDRKGKIIARSRKSNLIDEYGLLNVMETPEPSIFDTDFGVRFGSIVCFDVMFEETLLTLTRKLNITDIVLSSGWYSEMPFLTTIQMQAGWAYAEDVNLLSSGYNNIGWGDSGSGIYAGRQGVVTAILPLHHHEEMLIADVLKRSPVQHILDHDIRLVDSYWEPHVPIEFSPALDSEGFKWRYDKLDSFESKLIAENGYTVEMLSHVGIDCEFRVNITNLSPYGETYRLLAFDDSRQFGDSLALGTRVCAIVLCANDTLDSCGHIANSSATLNSIEITAIYVDNGKTIMMPSTLKTDMMPFKNWIWNEYEHKDHIHTSIVLTRPTQDLVTFGIWGRNFEKDIRSSASTIFTQLLCLPFLWVLLRNLFTIF